MGLIGPNGAGKSTLVNVLSGFDHPTQGHVWFEGRDVTRWARGAGGAGNGLARTFQHSHAFRSLTVRENVEVSALGAGASPGKGRSAARPRCSSCSASTRTPTFRRPRSPTATNGDSALRAHS